jgi:hypothetical protein
MGLKFDPLTGEPTAWNLPETATVTWCQEATAYALMKVRAPQPIRAGSRAAARDQRSMPRNGFTKTF